MELLKDFSSGPLDKYRKNASFDWKKLKVLIETEDMIRYKDELIEDLKKEPICHPTTKHQTIDELRRQSILRMKYLMTIPQTELMNMVDNLDKYAACMEVLVLFDPSTSFKNALNRAMFTSVIQTLGTEKHTKIVEGIYEGKHYGCFCLTEIAHGSNAKGMKTRVTYSKESKDFIIHTPDFEAAKCWSGNLAKNATHAIVYAQLYTPDGVCHGLQQFVIQVRDEKTLLPYPGIIVGDMGEKHGLNGLDNGFLMFNNYHVSRDALLNKHGNVTEDGNYVTSFKDPTKQFGASLAALSAVRVIITIIASAYLTKSISIAIRYSAIRKQFGPNDKEELPVLEYQSQQYRLLPYLAGAYALKIFATYLVKEQIQNTVNGYLGIKREDAAEYGIEMHGLSSASKVISGWLARDAIQECREACGGHGYLKASGFGILREDNDANCTYEGENNILHQQTSNWLLKIWVEVLEGKKIASPMQSINFLTHAKQIINDKFQAENIEQISRPEYIMRMYHWLVCYLLKITHDKYKTYLNEGKDSFEARNNIQVFYAKNLALAYVEHFIIHRFVVCINKTQDPSVKNVLVRVLSLYGLFSIEKHIGHLYQGGFFTGEAPAIILQNAILQLCKDLKDDAVALVDAIAPCDFLMNSILGYSDGQVYNHIHSAFFSGDDALARPTWWKEIVNWQSSKL